jgi:signal transduction histidine kinase
VLKHSRASEVRVRVTAADSTIELAIEDNGCGFDPGRIPSGRKGNGLENMRRRIAEAGGELNLVTAPGQGARLTFTVRVR